MPSVTESIEATFVESVALVVLESSALRSGKDMDAYQRGWLDGIATAYRLMTGGTVWSLQAKVNEVFENTHTSRLGSSPLRVDWTR